MLVDLYGFTVTLPHILYLRAPIFIGRRKSLHFQFIAYKVRLKLVAWKASLLYIVRRVQLVKFVIQSMLVHFISIYNCSASIIKVIETWMGNFIWSGILEKKKKL